MHLYTSTNVYKYKLTQLSTRKSKNILSHTIKLLRSTSTCYKNYSLLKMINQENHIDFLIATGQLSLYNEKTC